MPGNAEIKSCLEIDGSQEMVRNFLLSKIRNSFTSGNYVFLNNYIKSCNNCRIVNSNFPD